MGLGLEAPVSLKPEIFISEFNLYLPQDFRQRFWFAISHVSPPSAVFPTGKIWLPPPHQYHQTPSYSYHLKRNTCRLSDLLSSFFHYLFTSSICSLSNTSWLIYSGSIIYERSDIFTAGMWRETSNPQFLRHWKVV